MNELQKINEILSLLSQINEGFSPIKEDKLVLNNTIVAANELKKRIEKATEIPNNVA